MGSGGGGEAVVQVGQRQRQRIIWPTLTQYFCKKMQFWITAKFPKWQQSSILAHSVLINITNFNWGKKVIWLTSPMKSIGQSAWTHDTCPLLCYKGLWSAPKYPEIRTVMINSLQSKSLEQTCQTCDIAWRTGTLLLLLAMWWAWLACDASGPPAGNLTPLV